MNKEITAYNNSQSAADKAICVKLAKEINAVEIIMSAYL